MRSTSITTLMALFALAGGMQAIAAAPAAAMDDTGTGSECLPMEWLPRGSGVDGEGHACSILDGSGGDGLGDRGVDGGSTGTGTPGGDQIIGEPIYVNDPLPECLRSAWKCLPFQPGVEGPSSGREDYLGGGFRAKGPSATKARGGRKTENPRTRKYCEAARRQLIYVRKNISDEIFKYRREIPRGAMERLARLSAAEAALTRQLEDCITRPSR